MVEITIASGSQYKDPRPMIKGPILRQGRSGGRIPSLRPPLYPKDHLI